MIEIIPAIIAKSFKELKEKVEMVEPYVKWVQLDIMDGKFVPNTTWNEPEDLRSWKPKVLMEAHLMIAKPEKVIEDWVRSGVKRIYFHYEATSQHEEIISAIKENKIEAGIALLPETPLNVIEPFAGSFDAILLFAGSLGSYGGVFKEKETLPKIVSLRKAYPNSIIEVDGGMNPQTAKEAIEAGANVIVAGSYIFGSADIKKSIDELKSACLS